MNQVSEKRADRRLSLNFDVEFSPGLQNGVAVPCAGITRNVSAGGVFFETCSVGNVESGTELLLKISVPRHDGEQGEPLVLKCTGTVCRLEPLDEGRGRMGLAVQFSKRPNVELDSLSKQQWDPGWEA